MKTTGLMPASAISDQNPLRSPRGLAPLALGLVLITAALFWSVTRDEFTNIDDPRFVTQNEHVQAGLTWPGIVWAFHSVYTEAWQPVTWMSHMLDCQLYGLKPWGHHLTSLLIHAANTVLLFLWLNQLTGYQWRSAFVAALFAWHPLHVESVAWVCERKDVLSAFFWMLCLLAYTRYARAPRFWPYCLLLALFALGLMAKPMVITLPCVLLLLDFWPLKRFANANPAIPAAAWPPFRSLARLVGVIPGAAKLAVDGLAPLLQRSFFLLLEKIPFFVLGAGGALAAIHAEKAGNSLATLGGFPLQLRLENALASYLIYLTQVFWPTGLACFYPYSFHIPLLSVLGGGLLLATWTGWFLLRLRQQPYLLVGWLWFVGTLVPTIGLVQFCMQARADRYTYIPSIGLFIALVWGVTEFSQTRPAARKWLPVLGGAALAACVACSAVQLTYWKNSLTLARHAIEVTDKNYVAYESAGRAISAMGQPERSLTFFAQAVDWAPDWPQGQFNYGLTLAQVGQTNGALEHLQAAIRLVPDFPEGWERYGDMLLKFGKFEPAAGALAHAARLEPASAEVQINWGRALAGQKQYGDALAHFAQACRLRPDDPEFRFDFGMALLDAHQPGPAAEQFGAELKLAPDAARGHYRLAQALEQEGKNREAIAEYRAVLEKTPDFPEAKAAMNRLLAAHPDLK